MSIESVADAKEKITRFCELMFRPGELVELRVLKTNGGIASGYFNDPIALATAAAEWNGRGNVYFTLNEPNPECIHRAENVVRNRARETTGDREIIRRRFLLIDADPERAVSGIASTDTELQTGLDCANRIRFFLQQLGWPEPIFASSGNGGHLLYRIDLPADDSGLVAAVLQRLSTEHSGAGVKVDTSVHNAARISRMYGSINMKGSSTAERPWRNAKVFFAPESLEIVPRELLESLAGARAARDPQPSTPLASFELDFDLKGFLDKHGLAYREKQDSERGTMYLLQSCPFASHAESFKCAAWLWNGSPCFKCFAEKCNGKQWAEFKDAILLASAPAASPSPELPESHDDPHRLARIYLVRYQHPDAPTYCYFAGAPYVWENGTWRRREQSEIDLELTETIKAEFDRWGPVGREKKIAKVTRGVVNNCSQALNSMTRHAGDTLPFWIGSNEPWPAGEVLACRNGLIHLPSYANGGDYLRPLTPRYFSTLNLGYDFEASGPPPQRWLEFLKSIWPNDPDSIALVQEYGGYLLTLDTRFQKALMVKGPPRSGKGTICRAWQAMLGGKDGGNIGATDLSKLASPHGLEGLVGKSFVSLADAASLRGAGQTAAVSNLLGIIGEDMISIDPKFRPIFSCRLSTRFAIFTNHMLDLPDTAGALTARLLVLRMTESFLDREDKGLGDALNKELPGILRWHIEGWVRLQKNGEFTQPATGGELLAEFSEANSPIGAFVKARCILDADAWTESQSLYDTYREWCAGNGRTADGQGDFFRGLTSAAPRIRHCRPRRDNPLRPWGYAGISLAESEFILPIDWPGTLAGDWVGQLLREYIVNRPPLPAELLALAN